MNARRPTSSDAKAERAVGCGGWALTGDRLLSGRRSGKDRIIYYYLYSII